MPRSAFFCLLFCSFQYCCKFTTSFVLNKFTRTRGKLIFLENEGIFRIPGDDNDTFNNEPSIKIEELENVYNQFGDEEIQSRVMRQMEYAFDNIPIYEVQDMCRRLWKASMINVERQNTCINLIALTKIAEQIEEEAERRQSLPTQYYNGMEDLYDSMRVTRSRIRMYGKDADFCGPNGEDIDASFRWPWDKK